MLFVVSVPFCPHPPSSYAERYALYIERSGDTTIYREYELAHALPAQLWTHTSGLEASLALVLLLLLQRVLYLDSP